MGHALLDAAGTAATFMRRFVCSCSPAGLGPARRIWRGIGMGGTASPFVWVMGFDPIIDGVVDAFGVQLPTYVDDSVALTTGPRETLAVGLFLIVASRCAGLQIQVHTCEATLVDSDMETVRGLFRALPVSLAAREGQTVLRGLPSRLACFLAERVIGVGRARRWQGGDLPCTCRVKTAIVPDADVAAWQAAMGLAPFGPACVQHSHRCLGVIVVGRARGHGSSFPPTSTTPWP